MIDSSTAVNMVKQEQTPGDTNDMPLYQSEFAPLNTTSTEERQTSWQLQSKLCADNSRKMSSMEVCPVDMVENIKHVKQEIKREDDSVFQEMPADSSSQLVPETPIPVALYRSISLFNDGVVDSKEQEKIRQSQRIFSASSVTMTTKSGQPSITGDKEMVLKDGDIMPVDRNQSEERLRVRSDDDDDDTGENNIIHHQVVTGNHSFDFKSIKKEEFERPVERHPGVKPYTCSVCSYRSTNNSRLAKHIRSHSIVESYAIWPSNNGTSSDSAGHVTSVRRPYACAVCDFRSSNSSRFNTHIRTHVKPKKLTCSVCPCVFASENDLLKHNEESHRRKKPYGCSTCDFRTTSSNRLSIHKKAHNQSSANHVE